jgi:hypothetical protein
VLRYILKEEHLCLSLPRVFPKLFDREDSVLLRLFIDLFPRELKNVHISKESRSISATRRCFVTPLLLFFALLLHSPHALTLCSTLITFVSSPPALLQTSCIHHSTVTLPSRCQSSTQSINSTIGDPSMSLLDQGLEIRRGLSSQM